MERKIPLKWVGYQNTPLIRLWLLHKIFGIKIFLSVLLLGILQKTNAQQWHYYKELPVNVAPKAVASNNQGTLFMLTADNKVFYKTLEGTWNDMTYWGLVSAESISSDQTSNRVYIGTTNQGLQYSSNFGASWTSKWLETNTLTGHHEGYSCFAQTSNPNLFFAGHFGKPKISVFTGQGATGTVKTISNDFNASPTAIIYTSNQKLLVGNHLGVWISDDNGTTFSQTNHNAGHVFCFTEGQNGRIFALNRNITTQEITLLSSDDYLDWTEMEVPAVGENYTTIFYNINSQELWLGSSEGIYKMGITNDAWEDKNLNNNLSSVQQIISDNNNSLYHFSLNHVAQQLATDGSGWLGINEGLIGSIDDMTFSSENTLYSYSNYFSPMVSILGNQFQNWSPRMLGTAMNGVRNLFIATEGTVFANTSTKLFRLESGTTFVEFDPPQEISAQATGYISIFKKGMQEGIFISHTNLSQKIFGSYDNGNTWQVVSNIAGPGVFSTFSDFSQDANGRFYCLLSGGTFKVYTSLTGQTWDLIPFNYNDFSFSFSYSKIKCFGNRTFIIDSKRVFEIITNENGSTIVDVSAPFLSSENPLTDFKLTATGKFIINTYTNGVYQSSDNAATWNSIGFPTASVTDNSPLETIGQYDTLPFVIMKQNNPQNVTPGIYYYVAEPLSMPTFGTNQKIQIFPNPATSILNIKSPDEIRDVAVWDSTGKSVISSNEHVVDVSNLAEGLYLIVIQTVGGVTHCAKFLKR
jgi:hypothetical protein